MTPGNYIVQVFPRSFDGRVSEFGRQRVTVGDGNLENVVVVMSRGAVLHGTITTDEGTPLPVTPQQVNVFVRPAEPELMMPTGPAKVNDDWTFEVSNLDRSQPHQRGGSAQTRAVGRSRASFTTASTSPTRRPTSCPARRSRAFEIVFTRKVTVVSGTITDARGKPDLDATVVAFAQDSRRWTPVTRFTRSARPNQDGRYTLRGLPPEDYFVAVVKEIEPGRMADPEISSTRCRDQAVRITRSASCETKTQDLSRPRPAVTGNRRRPVSERRARRSDVVLEVWRRRVCSCVVVRRARLAGAARGRIGAQPPGPPPGGAGGRFGDRQLPPRDPRQVEAARGTAVVRGTIVAADNGEPHPARAGSAVRARRARPRCHDRRARPLRDQGTAGGTLQSSPPRRADSCRCSTGSGGPRNPGRRSILAMARSSTRSSSGCRVAA